MALAPNLTSSWAFVNGPNATAGRPDPGGGETSSIVLRVTNSRIARGSGSFRARSASLVSAFSTSKMCPSLDSWPGRIFAGSSTTQKRPLSR